eukprot:1302196-Pleurochrysis_carterae.AAC.1
MHTNRRRYTHAHTRKRSYRAAALFVLKVQKYVQSTTASKVNYVKARTIRRGSSWSCSLIVHMRAGGRRRAGCSNKAGVAACISDCAASDIDTVRNAPR